MVNQMFYSVKDLSIVLGVSERTIRRAIENNSIKSVRVCRQLRIPLSEVDRLLKGEAWEAYNANAR